MALQQVIEIYELLDSAKVNGKQVVSLLRKRGLQDVKGLPIQGKGGKTDSIRVMIPGDRREKIRGRFTDSRALSDAWEEWERGHR